MSVSCRNRAGQHGDFQIAQDLNSWRGFGVEPRQGDWSLMQAHIRDVLADGDQEAEGYILNWAAWAVQNPGKRAEAALVFRGDEGTGKGVFLHALREIFGVLEAAEPFPLRQHYSPAELQAWLAAEHSFKVSIG